MEPTVEAVLKEACWLAWQACGGTAGYGILQNKPGATKEDVWKNILVAGDSPGGPHTSPEQVHADYVFGRMMKLYLAVEDGAIVFPSWAPTVDYQAWCGTYPGYEQLLGQAIRNTGVGVAIKKENQDGN